MLFVKILLLRKSSKILMSHIGYGTVMKKMSGFVNEKSFISILFTEGTGTIRCRKEMMEFQKGDSFFISAGSGAYEIDGICEALITMV